MDNVELLVTLHRTIREYWEELAEVAPETVLKLQDCLKNVTKAELAAKSDLRELGPGTHYVSGEEFEVRSAAPKVKFDVDEVVMEAEDSGQLDLLMDAGFIKYAVDSKQINRLPPEIKVRYQKMGTETPATPRVYLPKNL